MLYRIYRSTVKKKKVGAIGRILGEESLAPQTQQPCLVDALGFKEFSGGKSRGGVPLHTAYIRLVWETGGDIYGLCKPYVGNLPKPYTLKPVSLDHGPRVELRVCYSICTIAL